MISTKGTNGLVIVSSDEGVLGTILSLAVPFAEAAAALRSAPTRTVDVPVGVDVGETLKAPPPAAEDVVVVVDVNPFSDGGSVPGSETKC